MRKATIALLGLAFSMLVLTASPMAGAAQTALGAKSGPVPLHAYVTSNTTIEIRWNSPLNATTAQNLANYSLQSSDFMFNTAVLVESTLVRLTTSSQAPVRNNATPQFIEMANIRDQNGVLMTPAVVEFIAGVCDISFIQTQKNAGAGNDTSVVAGYTVCTAGVVTAGTSDEFFGDGFRFFIERSGGGVRSGLEVRNTGNLAGTLVRGDSVRVSGLVGDAARNTTISSLYYSQKLGTKPVPGPDVVSLATALTEDYEGVYVRIGGGLVSRGAYPCNEAVCFFEVPVGLTLAGGDSIVINDSDGDGYGAIELEVGSDLCSVEGPAYFDLGTRRIYPRAAADICIVPALPDTCVGPGWQPVDPLAAPPGPRYASALVTEESRAVLILFGGTSGGGNYDDTWEWQGDRWSQRFPPTGHPSARFGHAMAYDRARNRVVLFGGEAAGQKFGDTWEWNGTSWTQVSASGPSARAGHVMAYDEVLQRVILFGGDDGVYRGDTWSWSGSSWSLLTTSGPSARAYAAAGSDRVLRRVILFGGKTTSNPATGLADTWEWNGSVWSQATPSTSPPARSRHVMAFGEACGQVVLSGGDLVGAGDLTDTWMWNGTRWFAADIGLFMTSPAAAYDIASSRMIAFGGLGQSGAEDVTRSHCCECDDEIAVLDSLGNVVFPATLDPDAPITYQDVDDSVGYTEDVFPEFDTDSDTWYENWPCLPAIGGEIPEGTDEGSLDDSLAALGITVPSQLIVDSLAAWANQILTYAQAQPPVLPTAPPTGPTPPYTAPSSPYCPPANGTYIFGGRDIVFVHGLQLDHIFDRVLGVPGAQVNWVPPSSFPGSTQNPTFYNTGGYYRDIAVDNWAPHIQRFFLSRGIMNRYVIITYPCNARFDVGIQALLTQVGDAMRFGTNVVDLTGRNNVSKFGTPSFVIVSHSTGGPIVDAMLWAAQNHPNLKADFVAKRCKAHVSLSGAFEGSRFASAAVALSPALTLGAGSLAWLCPLVNLALPELGHAPVSCPPDFGPVENSVLIDLSPRVTEAMWGHAIDNTNVPTVLATGGHPSIMGPLKHIFHPGFDDGVLCQNSVTPNPGASNDWPQGFVTNVGLRQTFDKGMKEDSPKRARKFYLDQVRDPALQPTTGPLPSYVAASQILYLSTAGMLQSVGVTFPNTSLDPLQRRNQHLSFMASTADHFSIRSAEFYPNYKPTDDEANWEEIRTLRKVDEAPFRLHYTPGPVAYTGDDQPLLEAGCAPPVSYTMMGRYVEFKIKILGKKYSKRWWIWKRHYFRPAHSSTRHICDYVYGSILACGDGIPKCDVSTGLEDTQSTSFSAVATPNPFAGELAIEFRIPQAGNVAIDVYDTQGRHVRSIADRAYVAGTHHVRWDGRSDGGRVMPSGHYFWKLRVNGAEETTEKVLLVR